MAKRMRAMTDLAKVHEQIRALAGEIGNHNQAIDWINEGIDNIGYEWASSAGIDTIEDIAERAESLSRCGTTRTRADWIVVLTEMKASG